MRGGLGSPSGYCPSYASLQAQVCYSQSKTSWELELAEADQYPPSLCCQVPEHLKSSELAVIGTIPWSRLDSASRSCRSEPVAPAV